MAEFVKSPNSPQPTSYVGYSQGVSAPKGDDSLETLFKGVGNLLNQGVKAVDEGIQTKIDNELYAGIDAIRGAQGVDAAVQDAKTTQLIPDDPNSSSASGGVKTPAAVDSATSEIARLNAAYKDGKIGDSQYWAKTEALVRQVRARYPGYREEIDKKVSSITGSTPANALRRSLLEDLTNAQNKEASKIDKFDTFMKSNLDSLSPETRKRWAAGDRSPTFQASAYDEVGTNKLQDAEVSREKSRIELAEKKGTLQQHDAVRVMTNDVNQYVNRTLNAGISAAGGSGLLQRITQLQKDASTGKAPSPEELTQIRSQFALLKSQLASGIDTLVTKPGESGNSYSSLIRDKSQVDAAKKQAMSQVENLEQLLTSGDFGLFAVNANAIKASTDSVTRKLLESNDFLRKLNGARDILGKEGMGVWLNSQAGMTGLSEVSKAINDLNLSESVLGQGNGVDQLKRLTDQATRDPAAYRNYLDTHSKVLGDAKTPVQAVQGIGKTFYSSGDTAFINRFQESQRGKVFAKMTTPEITQNMIKLKGSDPTSWENYRNWAGTNFYAINKQAIDTLATNPGKEFGVAITVDETGRLRLYDSNPGGAPKMQGGFRDTLGASMVRQPLVQRLQSQIDQFNSGLSALEPILKADNLDIKNELRSVYKQMGLAIEGDKESGNGEAPEVTKTSLMGQATFKNIANTIQLDDNDDSLIDLDAQAVRRSRNTGQADPNWKASGNVVPPTADLKSALDVAARELGTTAEDLATVISYETGGTFDPSIRGGAGNRHIGLIQFGKSEQATYGANQEQSVGEQMQAVVRYLKHRGFRPGMDILDLYSTINAGAPGLYNRTDAFNGGAPGTVRDKVEKQMGRHRAKARGILGTQTE